MSGSCLLAAGCAAVPATPPAIAAPDPSAPSCWPAGGWVDPHAMRRRDPRGLFAELAAVPVVLLGESHDNAEHHRWQLHTLAGLYALNPRMVVGFEMFPRSTQDVLDRWSAGALDEDTFLREARWTEVWGYDPRGYLPLFHFVRHHRIPAVALNIDRSLVARVSREGWASIPLDRREGVTSPAPVSEPYSRALAQVYLSKRALSEAHGTDPSVVLPDDWDPEQISAVSLEPGFRRFVEAQSLWDRAMADGLAQARRDSGASLAVGIMGRGHVEFGHGVPHQLADLGIRSAVLLPVAADGPCAEIEARSADAVFVVDGAGAPPRPHRALLGVVIEPSADQVRLADVHQGSIAEAAGLRQGDVIIRAAGREIRIPADLVAVVRRQAPGTWLPLEIRRDTRVLDLVARFPPHPDQGL